MSSEISTEKYTPNNPFNPVNRYDPFFATTFSRLFKDQSGAWRNGTWFGLNDLEALLTVAREAREWMAAHALKR